MTTVGQGRFLFDTNAALYFLGNVLTDVLPIGSYHISLISEIELLSYPNLATNEEGAIPDFLSKIETVGLRSDVTEAAITFRRHKWRRNVEPRVPLLRDKIEAYCQIPEDSLLRRMP